MRAGLAVGCLLGAAACRPFTPTSAPAPRVAPAQRVDARLLAMADARRADTVLLDSVLTAHTADVASAARRRRAVLLVGQLRERSRYGVLRALVADPDTAIAATAAFALGLARDTASVDALAATAIGNADAPASEAAWALGALGEPGRDAVERALAQAESGAASVAPSRLVALLRAASVLRPVPVARIRPFLHHTHARVAEAAAYAIARPRAVAGVADVLALHAHPAAEVRAQVAVAAARAATGDSLADRARSALRSLVRDADLQVRVQAVRSAASQVMAGDSTGVAVGQAPEHARLREALLAAIRDPAAPVRAVAAEVIGPMLGRDSAAWQAAFVADSTYMVQRALLDGAVRRGQLLHERDRWQHHDDPWRRVAALEWSALLPSAAAPLERTAWARRDPAPRVRAAALSALAGVAEQPAARAAVVDMLQDTAALVRSTALGVLSRSATARDAERAASLYRVDSLETTRPVRSAALRVIAAAWRRDSLAFDDSLKAALSRWTAPSDPAVRAGVRDVAPLAHWSAVELVPRSVAEYERIAARWLSTSSATASRARLHTARGVITLDLLASDAPVTVDNFVQLARRGWFDGTRFHRVIPGFVAQDGDPTGTGSGGPGTTLRDELNRHRYERGAVGMALSGPDTGGSQYFLTLTPQPHLDGGYTVFARVVDGLRVMDELLLGDRILRVEVP